MRPEAHSPPMVSNPEEQAGLLVILTWTHARLRALVDGPDTIRPQVEGNGPGRTTSALGLESKGGEFVDVLHALSISRDRPNDHPACSKPE